MPTFSGRLTGTLRDVLDDLEKHLCESPADTVADKMSETRSYMSAIFADSVAQFSSSFWTIHSKSIHMKLVPSRDVSVMSSLGLL